MIKSVDGFANVVGEVTHGIYKAVMGVPKFNKATLMHCLKYLMKNKGVAEGFLEMDEVDKEFWLRGHLAATKYYL